MLSSCDGLTETNQFQDTIYKDVVIIGNGPSGIILSYILSGNWPHYNGQEHPDEMLTMRLRSIDPEKSLIEQDLQFLSQNLEGRSRNPVAVLLDSLVHPTDDYNTSSLIKWKYHPDKAIDHLVLGKHKPGGCWQKMNENIATISVSSWMELPEFSLREWENKWFNLKCACRNTRPPTRLKTKQVAAYYRDYVQHMKLTKNFRNDSVVFSVKKVQNIDDCKSFRCDDSVPEKNQMWEVAGYDHCRKKNFKYICNKVVLATGTSDDRNMLNVRGELGHPKWVFHELKQFESAIIALKKSTHSNVPLDPVMVIGSGLSAADAVLIADSFGLSVLHVFKSFTFLNDHKLSKNMYPEYYEVFSLMRKNEQSNEYKALSQYEVLEMCNSDKGNRVRVKSPDGLESWYKVTLVAVMIGYRPALNFLPDELQSGKVLGVKKNQPIDCQKNPIAISPWTYEVLHDGLEGLYAMGPLVGDTVVRVIPGGAVAVASHVYKTKMK